MKRLNAFKSEPFELYFPNLHYEDALIEAGMESLHGSRQVACNKFFKQILQDPNPKLNNLIPKIDTSLNYQLCNDKKIHVPNSILNVLKTRILSLVE